MCYDDFSIGVIFFGWDVTRCGALPGGDKYYLAVDAWRRHVSPDEGILPHALVKFVKKNGVSIL